MAWLIVRPYTYHRDWQDIDKFEGRFANTSYQASAESVPYDLTHRVEWAPPVANGPLGAPLDPYQEYTAIKNMGSTPVLLYHNTLMNWPNPPFEIVILPGHWVEVVDLDTFTQPRIRVDSALYSAPCECEILQIGYQCWEEEEPQDYCDAWAVGHVVQDGALTKHYPELGLWATIANPINNADHFLADVAGVAVDDYWAVGYELDQGNPTQGLFAYWNGVAWAEVLVTDDPAQFGVWGFATDDFWSVGGATGSDGEIWHYDGINWSIDCVPEPQSGNTYYCVYGNTPANIYVGGSNGSILWYNGVAWSTVWGSMENWSWYGTWTSGTGQAWVCGGSAPWLGVPGGAGAIYRQVAPAVWIPDLMDVPEPPTQRAMWGFANNDVWSVGDNGSIFHWTGGPMWNSVADPCEGQYHYRGVFGCWPWGVWAIGTDEATGDNVIIYWDGMVWAVVHGPNVAEGELLGLKGVWVGGPI